LHDYARTTDLAYLMQYSWLSALWKQKVHSLALDLVCARTGASVCDFKNCRPLSLGKLLILFAWKL